MTDLSRAERDAKYVADAVSMAMPYFLQMQTGEIDGVSARAMQHSGYKFCVLFAHAERGDQGRHICIVPLHLADALNSAIAQALTARGYDIDGVVARINTAH